MGKNNFYVDAVRIVTGEATIESVGKDCLNLMGMNVGNCLKPVSRPCSDEKLAEIKKILEDLDLN